VNTKQAVKNAGQKFSSAQILREIYP